MQSTRRGAALLVSAAMGAGLLTSCWSSPAYPMVVAGLRMVDGQLEYWAGAQCDGVGEVTVEVPGESGAEPVHSWTMTAVEGTASLEAFVVGEPPSGFVSVDPPPDWPVEGTVRVQVRKEDGGVLVNHRWSLGPLAESEDHRGEWYADDHGWMDEEEFAELVDKGPGGFYPFCEMPER